MCFGLFKNSDSRKLANTRCLGMYRKAATEVNTGRRSGSGKKCNEMYATRCDAPCEPE